MMKRSKLFILCAVFAASVLMTTGCGNNRNDVNEAPYEDETQNGVNSRSNMYNGTTQDNTNNPGSDLRDAGRNLMDSVEDAGNSIRDGVNNIINDGRNQNNVNDTNNKNNINNTNEMNR